MLYPIDAFNKTWKNEVDYTWEPFIEKGSKVIDFDLTGGSQFIRFYVGDKDLVEWWGDDWDDVPYEHNSGIVSDKFIRDIVDVALPAECAVLQPCDGEWNSKWCKEDMFFKKVCALVVTADTDRFGLLPETFQDVQGVDKTYKIFMHDDIHDVLIALVNGFDAQIMGVYSK